MRKRGIADDLSGSFKHRSIPNPHVCRLKFKSKGPIYEAEQRCLKRAVQMEASCPEPVVKVNVRDEVQLSLWLDCRYCGNKEILPYDASGLMPNWQAYWPLLP
ncbi:hypothetical protein CEXT_166551 [Caerostris extrusa]|uniref:Uncharacterized protein n=1 Tax=Caerostris extrusa TaxID=172846 RepID=A0AAV4T181_CAEEX|nr:hypothetical protein CEXT_166551 [Caerostris extrusa]